MNVSWSISDHAAENQQDCEFSSRSTAFDIFRSHRFSLLLALLGDPLFYNGSNIVNLALGYVCCPGKGEWHAGLDLVNENKWAHPRKVSQMLCAKGPIVCPDRPILLSSKATHFALNSASLFSLSLLTSGNCCENLTCHGKRGGGGERGTLSSRPGIIPAIPHVTSW